MSVSAGPVHRGTVWRSLSFEEAFRRYARTDHQLYAIQDHPQLRAKVQIPIAEALYIALLPFINVAGTSPYVLPHVAERYTCNPAGIAKDTKRLLEAAGLHTVEQSHDPHRMLPVIRYSFHSFRHTFSTLAANHGVSIRTVQELLGHSSEKMTVHYTHIGLQTKVQAIEALPDLVSVKRSPQGRSLAELISGLSASELFQLGAWLDEHLTETQKEYIKKFFT